MIKKSGMNIPSVGISACAVVKHGRDIVAACNHVRTELGFPPMAASDFEEPTNQGVDEADLVPMERPTPISDALLKEIRRRVALRLKRSEQYLAAPKFFRAGADLCTPELRDEHWSKLREIDIEAVCEWHGIEHRKQRKAHLDRLREVRTYVKQLGPLNQLLGSRGSRAAAPNSKDAAIHKNLQMLLQTASGQNHGGSASR